MLDVDAPLPPTLEIFECDYYFSPTDALTIDHLPLGLKIAPYNLFSPSTAHRLDTESLIKRFQSLEYAGIHKETTIAFLSERLKRLDCSTLDISIDSALPSALTHLTMRRAISHENLKNIPPSLTALQVLSDPYAPDRNLFRHFPRWREYELRFIVDQTHLVYLTIQWSCIESGYSLAPLANSKTLKNFSVCNISLQGVLESPTWLMKCLPPNLEHLTVSSLHQDPDMPKTEEEEFSPVFDLERCAPRLASLNFSCNYNVRVNLTPSFFASLPQGLLKIVLYFKNANLHLNAISQLPRSLQSFSLGIVMTTPSPPNYSIFSPKSFLR